MGSIVLKPAVTKKMSVTKEIKPALLATICDNCGREYIMDEFCNESNRGILRGTFDKCQFGDGNGFSADVCSFKCAHDIMTGGWMSFPRYARYVKIGAILGRCELTITPYIVERDQLIKEWE